MRKISLDLLSSGSNWSERIAEPRSRRYTHNALMQALVRALVASIFLVIGAAAPALADFANGGFEDGTLGGWNVTTYLNSTGTTVSTPPEDTPRTGLGLTSGGTDYTSVVSGTGPESEFDPMLTSAASLRYPLYGTKAARVNYTQASSQNANSLKQSFAVTSADVDPLDNKAHVRFVVAPVFENAAHSASQQPYYFVNVRNVTKSTILYSTFKYVNQVGVPWKTQGAFKYTDWQLIDVAPEAGALEIGDTVEVEIIASRCQPTGHDGWVYVDGFGSFLPGLNVVATGPEYANDDTDITYVHNYRNGSASSVTNATVTIVLPTNTTFQSISAGGASCSTPSVGASGTITCNVGTLTKDATGSISVTVHINSGTTGAVGHGNYSISSDQSSALLGPLVRTEMTSGVTYADLEVEITNGIPAVAWGSPASYTMTVTNNGPEAVTGATAAYTPPVELTGVSWTCVASGSASCAASGSGAISEAVNIPVGGAVTFTISGSIIAGTGSSSTTHTATATVPGGVQDPYTPNNTAVDIDSVGALYALTVNKNAATGGSVVSAPVAISCNTSCSSDSADFTDGDSVTLTAVAATNFSFMGWSGGGCSGTSACTVVMSSARTVAAEFDCSSAGYYGSTCASQCPGAGNCSGHGTCDDGVSGTGVCTCSSGYTGADCSTPVVQYPLTVNKNTAAGGTVNSSPVGISCGTSCSSTSANFNSGTTVTLTATPATNFTFVGWSGGGCSGTGSCVVSVTAASSVTAQFDCSAAGFYGGSCALQCPGSGNCSGNGTCADGLTGAGTCSCNAGYEGADCSSATTKSLTVNKNTAVGGTVSSTPSGISCGTSCSSTSASFSNGATVTLGASPAANFQFVGWTGSGCSGSGSCVVTLSAARSVSAQFNCMAGYYGASCASQCGGSGNCSGHGTCSDGLSGSGACTCSGGYSGAACQISPAPGDIDVDDDGIPNATEGTTDKDGDSIGNNLDRDSDDDGIPDVVEAGGDDADGDGVADSLTDTDGDGLVNQYDSDNGGATQPLPDTDEDGTPDYLDRDSDGDAIPDMVEAQSDEPTRQLSGNDNDADGLDDSFDPGSGGTPVNLPDVDGDGGPDYQDVDADGDGISDTLEAYDADGNGVIDVQPSGIDADGDGLDDVYASYNSSALLNGFWRRRTAGFEAVCSSKSMRSGISGVTRYNLILKERAKKFSLRARACNGSDFSANTRAANAFARQLTNTLNRAVGGKVYTCPDGVCTNYSTVSAKGEMRAQAERLYRASRKSKLDAERACNHPRNEDGKPDGRKRTIDYYQDLVGAIRALPDSVTRCP